MPDPSATGLGAPASPLVTPPIFAELSPPYSTIVADPPWRMSKAFSKVDPGKHYSTLTIDDICAMPVAALAAPDAHLWLWAVNGLMEDAYRVVRAWGFSPVTLLTWCKPQPGIGHYLRNNTEHAIFATRGRPQTPDEKPLSTWFQWQRGAHSAKPAAFLDIVETVSPGPYVELFARAPRLGWDSWGKGYEIGDAGAPDVTTAPAGPDARLVADGLSEGGDHHA